VATVAGGNVGQQAGPRSTDAGAAPGADCPPPIIRVDTVNPVQATPDTVRPYPVEDPATTARRLGDALAGLLRSTLPAGTTVALADFPDCPVRFQYHPRYLEYQISLALTDSQGVTSLDVRVDMVVEGSERYRCPNTDSNDCEHTTLPDGTRIGIGKSHLVGDINGDVVMLHRADGTRVELNTLTGYVEQPGDEAAAGTTGLPEPTATTGREAPPTFVKTRATPVLTVDQLTTIGRAADLTLYP
jgi:hypothetical protein